MIPEKTNQYKAERRLSVTDEVPKCRKQSKTAKTSHSGKRSDHKHQYQKVILHYGGSTFVWGGQCQQCGRLDDSYKASNWGSHDFQLSGTYPGMSWRACCRREIHAQYPHHKIFVLCKDAQWREWDLEHPMPAQFE